MHGGLPWRRKALYLRTAPAPSDDSLHMYIGALIIRIGFGGILYYNFGGILYYN